MANITLYTRNIMDSGTVTVTTASSGYPASRLYDRSIDIFYKGNSTCQKYFTVDQGTTKHAVNFLAIEKHNFNGAGLKWQGSTNNWTASTNVASTWTQSGNSQIIRTLSTALTKRYWRVSLSTMAGPRCGEIYMSRGITFDVLQSPNPVVNNIDNVQWNRTIGGLERATKMGEKRRAIEYSMLLPATGLTDFSSAMAHLSGYSKPFYIKDHAANYWLCRLVETPEENYDHPTHTHIKLNIIEVL